MSDILLSFKLAIKSLTFVTPYNLCNSISQEDENINYRNFRIKGLSIFDLIFYENDSGDVGKLHLISDKPYFFSKKKSVKSDQI